MQCAIDNAKRTFDIDLNEEIDRIKKDMNIEENGYPIFWKHNKKKKAKIGGKKFNKNKINENLICPMNYLMTMNFKNSRDEKSTLPMSYFFNKFELEENRRKSKKVEELIEKYSLDLYKYNTDNNKGYTDYGNSDMDLLLREDFEDLLTDIKQTYISKTYIGLMSWLIDRAFLITKETKVNKNLINRKTNENKSLLLKVLYDINSNNVLKIFSKNL